jgi:hypothetical protein
MHQIPDLGGSGFSNVWKVYYTLVKAEPAMVRLGMAMAGQLKWDAQAHRQMRIASGMAFQLNWTSAGVKWFTVILNDNAIGIDPAVVYPKGLFDQNQ